MLDSIPCFPAVPRGFAPDVLPDVVRGFVQRGVKQSLYRLRLPLLRIDQTADQAHNRVPDPL